MYSTVQYVAVVIQKSFEQEKISWPIQHGEKHLCGGSRYLSWGGDRPRYTRCEDAC